MGKATQDLKKEHDAILHVLKIMEKMISSNNRDDSIRLEYGKEMMYFLKIFADKCHHGKEEKFLFAELIRYGIPNEGGPVGVMLKEHTQGREYISLMNKSLDSGDLISFKINAEKYRDLLKVHIAKENNVLFVMADQKLDEAKQEELYKQFEHHEENVIGHGVHEELHSMIYKWSKEFEVH